eukprot:CCRYP_002727-RJ/>CCRYP_002727-RJ protein AED:0.49 eAED:1.00 QI:0/-1/0/1/-1/0/1/0/15
MVPQSAPHPVFPSGR